MYSNGHRGGMPNSRRYQSWPKYDDKQKKHSWSRSNTGGDAIKRYAYARRQRPREVLTLKELEDVTFAAAYAEDGE